MTKARRRSRTQPVFRDRIQTPAPRRLTVRPRFRLLRIPVRRPDRRHLRPVRTPQRPRARRPTLHRGRTPKRDRNPLRPERMPALPPRRLAVRGVLLPGRRMLPRRNALKPVPQGRSMRPHRLFRAAVMSCWECSVRPKMRPAPSMRRRKRILRCAAESTVSGRNSWFRRSNRPIRRHVRSSSAITATGFRAFGSIPPVDAHFRA